MTEGQFERADMILRAKDIYKSSLGRVEKFEDDVPQLLGPDIIVRLYGVSDYIVHVPLDVIEPFVASLKSVLEAKLEKLDKEFEKL